MLFKILKKNSNFSVISLSLLGKVFVDTLFWIFETFFNSPFFLLSVYIFFTFHSTITCMDWCTKKIGTNWLPPYCARGHLLFFYDDSNIAILKPALPVIKLKSKFCFKGIFLWILSYCYYHSLHSLITPEFRPKWVNYVRKTIKNTFTTGLTKKLHTTHFSFRQTHFTYNFKTSKFTKFNFEKEKRSPNIGGSDACQAIKYIQ